MQLSAPKYKSIKLYHLYTVQEVNILALLVGALLVHSSLTQ